MDGRDPSSSPTAKQIEIFKGINTFQHRYLRGGNQSSKSSCGIREAAWIFMENHPYWERPARFGEGPLTMLILGRDHRQIEESLWSRIKMLLPTGSYKETRTGNTLQKVRNITNGNTIIFIPHNNSNEATKNAQSYPAHWVWIDEMPTTYRLIDELHRRVQANRGYFLATFTPKVVNIAIRKLVDATQEPHGKVYRLHMFDNPIYKDPAHREEVLASMSSYSEAYKKTLLEGEWALGEEQVYFYDPETMVEAPINYQPTWRHLLSVDPALKSKLGMTLWAEDPKTNLWYLVLAEYVEGIYDPEETVRTVEKKVENYNIVRRISDTEPWYVGTASRLGYTYLSVYEKANRKGSLIKGLQTALGTKVKIAPWCRALFEDEITSCRWSETTENKIANRSSFHILDTCQYAVDIFPEPSSTPSAESWHAYLQMSHERRKRNESIQKRSKNSYRKSFKITRRAAW